MMTVRWSVLTCLIFIVLTGCGQKSGPSVSGRGSSGSASSDRETKITPDLLIGKWEDTDATSLIVEFSKDGKITLSDKRKAPVKGTYAFTGGNQVEFNLPDAKDPKMAFKVALSGNELVMSDFQATSALTLLR